MGTKAEVETQYMKKHCLLACFFWKIQLFFLYASDPKNDDHKDGLVLFAFVTTEYSRLGHV